MQVDQICQWSYNFSATNTLEDLLVSFLTLGRFPMEAGVSILSIRRAAEPSANWEIPFGTSSRLVVYHSPFQKPPSYCILSHWKKVQADSTCMDEKTSKLLHTWYYCVCILCSKKSGFHQQQKGTDSFEVVCRKIWRFFNFAVLRTSLKQTWHQEVFPKEKSSFNTFQPLKVLC